MGNNPSRDQPDARDKGAAKVNDFDTMAATWEMNRVHQERTDAIARAIRSIVPLSGGMRALEVGCGTGLLSFALKEDLGTIVASDPSRGMVQVLEDKVAKTGAANIRPLRADDPLEALASGPFHLVFSQMALHHIPDVDGFLRTALGLLESDGWLCVADLDSEDGSFHGPGVRDIHRGFDRSELVDKTVAAGLEVVDIDTVFEMHRKVDGVDSAYPVFLLVARRPDVLR
jgi:2-polyprenyl-3-methyl-5-hydroxy-6-metoxy-1,4-benzoquinol methylase